MPPLVLVTGANGFIAAHVISQLLEQDYLVRGTVRSQRKADHFFIEYPKETESGKLSFVIVENISQAKSFNDAVKGNCHRYWNDCRS